MVIQLTDNYRLAADRYEWRAERWSGAHWTQVSHHPTPSSAIRSMADAEIRASDVASLEEALEEIRRVAARYDELADEIAEQQQAASR